MQRSDKDSVSSGVSDTGDNVRALNTDHGSGSTNMEAHQDAQAVYHDYSRDQSMLMSVDDTRESVQTFPMKLHSILSNPEFSNIVSWLPHGRAFRILQHKAFEEKVIPLYFRHGRYSSFARQVNGWGFKRIAHGPDYNSYYHELFLRGLPRLCEKMKRWSGKDEKKHEDNPDAPVPDFYALSRQNPLPEDNDDSQVGRAVTSTTNDAVRAVNLFNTVGVGDLSSVLRSAQADGATSVESYSGGGDVLGGLVLQALELRRNEIMQRLSSLVAEGVASSSPQAQSTTTADPLSSILSLLTAPQQPNTPSPASVNVAHLVANLLQSGSNASSTTRQSTPSAGVGLQGLQDLANKAAATQMGGGMDILALLREQQEYQQSKPSAQASSQPAATASASNLHQQLMNNSSAATLLQQLQGTVLGNNSSSSQTPLSQMYSRIPSHPPQPPNGALQFSSATAAVSGDTKPIAEPQNTSHGSRAAFQLPPSVDINSLLSGGPNALANLATLLQNQRSSAGSGLSIGGSSSLPQHKEQQSASANSAATSGPASSSRSASSGLPATIASLLGQMRQNNSGQTPSNVAALLGQLGQANRMTPQETFSQDQGMMRQQQQTGNLGMMSNQVSQLQALLGQQGVTPDLQSLLGQGNSSTGAGGDIRSSLQRQQMPNQSGQGLLALQNQLMGGGNLSMEQLQLAALLGLGNNGNTNSK